MNAAQYLLNQLSAWGVRHVYGVIGDAILPLMDALAHHDGLRFVPVRHESAAGFMASTEAKLTGRLAVCIGTSGPGLANLLGGLGDAYADRVPVLAITGQVESYKVGTDVKQYIDQQLMMAGMAGYSALVAGTGALPQILTQALKTAVGEGRPAHISVPKDYWTAPVAGEIHPPEPYLTAPPVAAPDVLHHAAALLRQAQRPVILAGHGAREAAAELLQLAEVWSAGVILALGGKGMLPGHHPLVLGGVGSGGGSEASDAALQAADLIFVVGSTWWPAQQMPQGVTVVQADRCPVNIGAKVPVAYGIAGDSRQVVPALLAELRADAGPDRAGWKQQLDGWKRAWEERLAGEGGDVASGPVHPAALVRALEAVAPTGSIITLDTGDYVLWFNRHFRGDGQRVLFSGTWRAMGYGLPAASAAKLCEPGARVIALVGDGGLGLLLGELSVPVQQGLDLTVVVARNGTLALEEHKARAEGFEPFGHVLHNPDFAAVARAFGWQAWRVDEPAQLLPVLQEAVATRGPALVDVWTANDPTLHLPKQ